MMSERTSVGEDFIALKSARAGIIICSRVFAIGMGCDVYGLCYFVDKAMGKEASVALTASIANCLSGTGSLAALVSECSAVYVAAVFTVSGIFAGCVYHLVLCKVTVEVIATVASCKLGTGSSSARVSESGVFLECITVSAFFILCTGGILPNVLCKFSVRLSAEIALCKLSAGSGSARVLYGLAFDRTTVFTVLGLIAVSIYPSVRLKLAVLCATSRTVCKLGTGSLAAGVSERGISLEFGTVFTSLVFGTGRLEPEVLCKLSVGSRADGTDCKSGAGRLSALMSERIALCFWAVHAVLGHSTGSICPFVLRKCSVRNGADLADSLHRAGCLAALVCGLCVGSYFLITALLAASLGYTLVLTGSLKLRAPFAPLV